jgi:apolipoprotein N-acyltransferase
MAASCGAMMDFAAPTVDFWPFSFLAWIPLILACEGQSPWRAFRLAWISGFVAVGWAYFWMTDLMANFGDLPWWIALIAHGLFATWSALAWSLPLSIATWFSSRWSLAWIVVLPLVWWGTELVWPEVFSVYLAFFWSWHPPAIQLAEIGGAGLVSAVMVAINSALALAILQIKRGHPKVAIRWIGLALGITVANWTYGLWRIDAVESSLADAKRLKVGLVQGNFGIRARARARELALSELQRVSRELESQGAELLIWGETSYPYPGFTRQSTSDMSERDPRRVRRGFSVPLLLGTVTHDRHERSSRKPWNTAWVVHPDGTLGDRYDKFWPLWFGEYAPFVDPDWYLAHFPNASQMRRGEGPGVLRVNEVRLGPLICYEDLLSTFAARTVELNVHALVNMTNDSWFGRSRAQYEHFALGLLRAVETRRALIRTVNAGPSAVIQPTGEITGITELTDADHDGYKQGDAVGLLGEIPLADPESRTIYVRIHSLLIPGIWGTLLALALWRRRKAKV